MKIGTASIRWSVSLSAHGRRAQDIKAGTRRIAVNIAKQPELPLWALRSRIVGVLHTSRAAGRFGSRRRLCLLPPTMPGGFGTASSGLSDWRGKQWQSPQFDRESIRPRTFAFSTFYSPASITSSKKFGHGFFFQ
jgi:hypothetical protein